MKLDELIGNDGIKKTLQRPFHAYIISGPKGSGKHTLARLLTAALVCEDDNGGKPCMKCSQCKKFLSGNHVDITYCGTDIKVKDLRETLKDALYLPNEAEHRVFVFDKAEKLSVICQNTLLKIVEEPPAYAVFIFITENSAALLQTLRSRCEILSMEPINEKDLTRYLQRQEFSAVSEEKKAAAVAFSGGYIGAARDFLSEEKTELYRRCDMFASALAKNEPRQMFDAATFKKREDLAEFVKELREFFAVHLRGASTGNNFGLNARVLALGQKKLVAIYTKLDEMNEKMKFNVNTSLFSTLIVSECYSECFKHT